MTISDVLRAYLRHAEVEGVHCAEARADRERTFRLFGERYPSLTVEEARPFHLTDFIEEHRAWKSVSTRRKAANGIRAALEWAAEQGRIAANPFRAVRYAEHERRPNLPDQTLDLVCRLANKRFEEAVRFLRYTACRLSELCRAEWEHVDLERGLWTIPRHKSRRYTGKPKVIALVPAAVELLRAIRDRGAAVAGAGTPVAALVHPDGAGPADPQGHIFLNNRGTPWNRRTLGQQLYRLKKRHRIETKASLHGIRHQAATAAVKNGAPIKHVAKMLGHAHCSVTERWYIAEDDLIEEAREAAALSLKN